MNTQRVVTRTAVVALTILMGACEDGPTLPQVGGDAEVQAVAALEQGATQAQAAVEESLGRMPEGPVPAGRGRPDQTRERPDTVRRPGDRPDHGRRAELAVALAAESIDLAERMLAGTDPTAEQLRHLDHAKDFLRRAGAALDQGRHAAAIQLAGAAQIAALKAVVLPRGISDEEARALHDVAENLLVEARAAVGADGSGVEKHLLALAARLFETGEKSIRNGSMRGVVHLWQSAAISSFLIG